MKNAHNLVEPSLRDQVKNEEQKAQEKAEELEAQKKTEQSETDQEAAKAKSAATNKAASKRQAESPLSGRLPKDIDIGQTLYVKLSPGAEASADKVKAVIIRETTVGILLNSNREVSADDIGQIIFLNEKEIN